MVRVCVCVHDALYGPFFMEFQLTMGMGDLFKGSYRKKGIKRGGETAALLWARATRIKADTLFFSFQPFVSGLILVLSNPANRITTHT